jgi:protease-4
MRFVVRFFAVVGLLFVLAIGLGIFAVTRINLSGRTPIAIKDGTVLTLTVGAPFIEESPTRTGLSALLSGHGHKLREAIDAIDAAAKDDRVKGLVIKLDASAGMAQTQELRAAMKRFRDGGKFIYAYSDDYGEGGSGDGQYYLASAADQIWLQPEGEAMLTDVAFEAPFVKNALAKLDIDPEFIKRAEYKTAPETFTETGYTPAAREMMESLANDLTLQLVTDIGASRGLSPADVRALFARGPLTAADATQAKLIDHVGYADEVIAAAKKTAGGAQPTIPLFDYYRQAVAGKGGQANIALIYEVGDIGRVEGPIDPDDQARGLDTGNAVVQGFERAIRNPAIHVIVFRVDSPGGSVSGSESIRRMVVRAKQAGKKIVVSMGSVAASGGYWISVDADKIVAEPATLTGSIGVFTGKFNLGKGLADYGITTDRTTGGPFTGLESPFTPFTPEQLQRVNATIDGVYDGFVSRVADGRKLPAGTVAQSAKGRVWSGQQAKQLGLVDSLGGLEDAIGVARELGGIPADQPTIIRVYPEPLSPIEALKALATGDSDIKGEIRGDFDTISADLDGPIGAMARLVSPLLRDPANARVRMPDLGLVR